MSVILGYTLVETLPGNIEIPWVMTESEQTLLDNAMYLIDAGDFFTCSLFIGNLNPKLGYVFKQRLNDYLKRRTR